MKTRTIAAVVAIAIAAAAAPSYGDSREKAAEHFALAEAAEKRQDWQAAIDEYELAYQASPHPWALFNIAANYQRLNQRRDAADYFRRYLTESPDAKDRADVEARIETLRSHPSRVEIISTPPRAKIFLDGEERGLSPQTITLAAGEHEVYFTHEGRRTSPQSFTVEYGDAITVRIDLDSTPGILVVTGDVSDAEIRLDGEVIGYTPYTGAVPAGEHQLLISKPGYQTIQRTVTVIPQGSQQIRANLVPIPGAKVEAPRTGRYMMGMGYGYDVTITAMRYLYELGYRSSSGRWEVSVLLGTLGGVGGGGIGLGSRLFLATGRVRPYIHLAGLIAGDSSGSSDRLTILEGGAGILILGSGPRSQSGSQVGRPKLMLDYFIEIDVNASLQEPAADESRFGIPIVAGIALQFGR